jgi:triacylglycerol lipase
MHPIVLAHGFFGFEKIAGLEYFRNVKKYFKNKFSDLNVIVTEVAPNDFIEQRAQQLWEQIDPISEKIHLIGHSMGGLDSRFLASPQGLNKSERLISLTTISTPHCGSPVADFIIDKVDQFMPADIEQFSQKMPSPDRAARKIIKILKTKKEIWKYLSELFNFTTKAMTNLTTSYLKQFNQKYLDAPNVNYFSYAGVTGPGEKDYLPPIMYLTWAIVFFHKDQKTGGRNDGLVAVDSAKWGNFKGEIPADHFKQVGYDLSGIAWLKKLLPCIKTFNHLKFFEKIVFDLRSLESNEKKGM